MNRLVSFVVLSLTASLAAQQAAVSFEVASVRENTSTATMMSYRWEPGGLRVSNMPVEGLLIFAYGITSPEMLIDMPGWARTARFDITASLSDAHARPDAERRAALRNLLADRFRLVMRPASQDADVFSLVKVAPTLGPSVRIGATKCAAASAAAQGGDSAPCRFTADRAKGIVEGRMTMNDLAAVLRTVVARPVIDRTALGGEYDITLRWAPEVGGVTLAPTDGASIFTAIEEQLGLRLVADKAPANAYIIEHIERPTPN
jgi:uncharacterized protein (TIGR03435 family)